MSTSCWAGMLKFDVRESEHLPTDLPPENWGQVTWACYLPLAVLLMDMSIRNATRTTRVYDFPASTCGWQAVAAWISAGIAIWRPREGCMRATVSVVVMALVLFSITIAGVLSGAENEPLAFKDYVLGVTRLSEMKQIDPRVICTQSGGAIAEDRCYSIVGTIADKDTKEATFFFTLRNWKKIVITMDHAKFEKVVSALNNKYGQPTREKMVPIQNRMGATIQGKE